MSVFINEKVYDEGLNYVQQNGDTFFLTTDVVTNLSQLANNDVTTIPSISIGPAEQKPGDNGRQVVVGNITEHLVTKNGIATHFGIADTVNNEVLICRPLPRAYSLFDGFTINVYSFTVSIPSPPGSIT